MKIRDIISQIKNSEGAVFVRFRNPCRRLKERRNLRFFGGFKGKERRKNAERRKGAGERRKSPA
ncbi:MAG TPA: hypothetical protein PK573_14265 [Spirochaetota bacterium]|nr:hypothetical protein [Spirochaetota bacterium]HRZ28673.1 hypothetical protein [Spirochaetota bacterium]HSA15574.1 hypothetical protein [Spirochaetota bacterium]